MTSPSPSLPVTVAPATGENLADALALLIGMKSDSEKGPVPAAAGDVLNHLDLAAENLLVASQNGAVVGTLVRLSLPGSVGLLFPPQVAREPARLGVEDALIRTAVAEFSWRGIRLCQLILPPKDNGSAAPFLRHGFRHLSRILRLRRGIHVPLSPQVVPGIRFATWREAGTAVLEATLSRTYHQSADCPELNGLQSPGEVLQGHQGDRAGRPESWWVVYEDESPVGVLLLNSPTSDSIWEIAYMGLVPEARRRRLGGRLVEHAVQYAAAAGATGIQLTVDHRNHPARRLYRSYGFHRFEEHEVYYLPLSHQ